MKAKAGKNFRTITDAAIEIGVSVSTVRRYQKSGAFPPPEREFFGSQSVAIYSDLDIENMRSILKKMRGAV